MWLYDPVDSQNNSLLAGPPGPEETVRGVASSWQLCHAEDWYFPDGGVMTSDISQGETGL